jgi:hypothetical protein
MVEARLPQYPDLRFLFHVPNGGHRRKATAERLKAAGMSNLLVPRKSKSSGTPYHGKVCQLKVGGGRLLPS